MSGLAPQPIFEIGSYKFQPQKMPFGVSRPLFIRALAICAPAVKAAGSLDLRGLAAGKAESFEALQSSLGSDGDARSGMLEAFGAAAEVFFDRARPEDFEAFEEAFASHCLVRGQGETKWSRMTDARESIWPELGYAAYTKWFVSCARIQFGPFSSGGSKAAVDRPPPPGA